MIGSFLNRNLFHVLNNFVVIFIFFRWFFVIFIFFRWFFVIFIFFRWFFVIFIFFRTFFLILFSNSISGCGSAKLNFLFFGCNNYSTVFLFALFLCHNI